MSHNYSLGKYVYLDSPATTQCDPRVTEKMVPFFQELYGNAHSKNHAYGWAAEEAVDIARMHIADFLGVDDREIIFTSGATEANIIAIRGIVDYHRYKAKTPQIHVITSSIEHKSIHACCEQLEEEGVRVTYLPVDKNGLVALDQLANEITNQTVLVSIMAVNNEIGVIQPLQRIGEICAKSGVVFHSDVTQAVGKLKIDFNGSNISLASLSSHKIYGPKGIGALFVKRRPVVRLRSIFPGGGQERGIRGGTLPVPLCVGFGEACRISSQEFPDEFQRISSLSERLAAGILGNIPLAKLNGEKISKVPHISNFAFPYVEGESIIMGLENICLSTGSACSSTSLNPSHVLQAMAVDEYAIQSSVRFGIHRFTTPEDIDIVLEKLPVVIEKLRGMSPLWDMYQEGVDFNEVKWM
ncbi:MAG: aminotransferase class V-fold PLP-dependent enzyme [Holosporales bacterium]|jgi:cysteine desulfurase|nr:aminotransferase class V-fold PLP-dependent enzyme [Holosporales bacterium]